jgi:uncharacterized protein (TIGR04255 family)
MAGGWQPIHENHAIDVMAAVVTFGQPLPDRLLRKALQVSEEVAFEAGLKSRHSLLQHQFVISSGSQAGIMPAMGGVRGQMFNAQLDSSEGQPLPGRVAEQLQVDQSTIIYRTWRYVSWSWQSERMRALMMPALSTVQDAVAISGQRLEYLDRFKFEGEPSSAEFSSLFREQSGLIAEHGFRRSDLWHSYTGFFDPSPQGTSTKRLFQINIDVLDEPSGPMPDAPKVRWANILTAREDRLQADEVDGGTRDPDMIVKSFDLMHTELKDLFGKVVTDAVAERVYLMGS